MLVLGNPYWVVPPRAWQEEAYAAVRRYFSAADTDPVVISAIMGAGKSLLISEIAADVRLDKNDVVVISTSTQHLVEDIHHSTKIKCGKYRSVGMYYGQRKKLGQIIVSCTPSVHKLANILQQKGKRVLLWIADEAHRTEAQSILSAYETLAPVNALGMTATPFRSSMLETLSLFRGVLYRYGVGRAKDDGVVVDWRIVHSTTGGELDAACVEMIRGSDGPGLANAIDIQDAEEFADLLSKSGISAMPVHSKMSRKLMRAHIRNLERGVLKSIVHVNMLSEGANFPWLQWLCLRRQVGSRVRFVQEIGRLLRSHPGKDIATFYDPHDLFGNFKLTYAEALGEAPERPEFSGSEVPHEVAERIADADPAIALAYIESAIRSLTVAADVAGMMRDRRLIRKAERLGPCNQLQRAALRMLTAQTHEFAPDGWKACLRAISRRPACLRFGFAADLITCLVQVKYERRWPPINQDGRIESVIDTVTAPQTFLAGRDGQLELRGAVE